MEDRGYLAVNSEKTIFMKRAREDWIIHGPYVDDMIHASTSDVLKQEFIRESSRDFYITLTENLTSFLGLEIEQGPEGINIHLDTYIQEVITEYKTYVKTALKPKKVPMQPGVMLDSHDCPEFKAPELRAIFALGAKYGASFMGSDTKQAFLNGDMGSEIGDL